MNTVNVVAILVCISAILLFFLFKAKLKVKELRKAYDNLILINNNLSKTFPELDKLILLTTIRANEDRIKLIKVERSIDAPDITEGEVYEVIVAVKDVTEISQLLSKTRGFVDDGWWTFSVLDKTGIIKISYLNTL